MNLSSTYKEFNVSQDLGEFRGQIDKFAELLSQLVDEGFAYFAVVLAHELYRFEYPVEPYEDFRHTQPRLFMREHFDKLFALADAYRASVCPYQIPLTEFELNDEQDSVEKRTSDLYSGLWDDFSKGTLIDESAVLLKKRVPADLIDSEVAGARVLDLGCGSGRYTLALARLGAAHVSGVDFQAKSFAVAKAWAEDQGLPVEFHASHAHELPFEDEQFDFVFCNGVLHHTTSIDKGMSELNRVLKAGHKSFLYLYAAGGIFWETRIALREVFKKIPAPYTKAVLDIIGLPENRFIFMDTWYVPIETWTTTSEMEAIMNKLNLQFEKVCGQNAFDLDGAIESGIEDAELMWGDGEHRYIMTKPAG